jgi:hypothetical protein
MTSWPMFVEQLFGLWAYAAAWLLWRATSSPTRARDMALRRLRAGGALCCLPCPDGTQANDADTACE